MGWGESLVIETKNTVVGWGWVGLGGSDGAQMGPWGTCTDSTHRQSVTLLPCNLQGTWHAGPLFDEHPHMDFYNLELSDTNVTDHNTHDYKKVQGWEFEVEEADDVCGSMCEMDSWE